MADDNQLRDVFVSFAKFGNPKSDGREITLTNADKWFKQAGIIDGKKVTTTDTGICFGKLKSKTLDFGQFNQYLDILCKDKKLELDEIKQKLAKCNVPGTSNAATAEKSGVVDRLTDTSKYTGAHKERFDASGKGKGKEGRVDEADTSGYVSGYKHKDTYDNRK